MRFAEQCPSRQQHSSVAFLSVTRSLDGDQPELGIGPAVRLCRHPDVLIRGENFDALLIGANVHLCQGFDGIATRLVLDRDIRELTPLSLG